jgi:WD40 repeat protein
MRKHGKFIAYYLSIFCVINVIVLKSDAVDSIYPMLGASGELQIGLGILKTFEISPDGEYMATGSGNGLFLWKLQEEKATLIKQISNIDVNDLDFSADGNLLIGGSSDGIARLWDLNSVEEINQFSHSDKSLLSVLISPDGSQVYLGDYNSIRRYNVADGTQFMLFNGPSIGEEMSLSPDGKWLVIADEPPIIWDVENEIIKERIDHEEPHYVIDFSPDSKWFMFSGGQHEIIHWDIESSEASWSKHQDEIGHPITIHYSPPLAVSSDGSEVVSGSHQNGIVRIWDSATGDEIQSFNTNQSPIIEIDFSSDSQLIYVRSGGDQLNVYNRESGNLLFSFPGFTSTFRDGAFSQDASLILTGNGSRRSFLANEEGNKAFVWNGETGEMIHMFDEATTRIAFAAFIENDSKIVTASQSGEVNLIDLASGKSLNRFAYEEDVFSYYVYALSPDEKHLLIYGENKAVLHDIETGEQVQTYTIPISTPRDVAFSPDGKTIAIAYMRNIISGEGGEGDGEIALFDRETGEHLDTFITTTNLVFSIAFSPDGKRIAAATSSPAHFMVNGFSGLEIWDINQGDIVQFIDWIDDLNCTAYSPDGKLIAVGNNSGSLTILNSEDAEELWSGKADEYVVTSVVFSPDGQKILTTGMSSTRVWTLAELIPTTAIQSFMIY